MSAQPRQGQRAPCPSPPVQMQADEYDAAQAAGQVATPRDGNLGRSNGERPATAKEVGLTRKEVHDARQLRDAEQRDPGVTKRTDSKNSRYRCICDGTFDCSETAQIRHCGRCRLQELSGEGGLRATCSLPPALDQVRSDL